MIAFSTDKPLFVSLRILAACLAIFAFTAPMAAAQPAYKAVQKNKDLIGQGIERHVASTTSQKLDGFSRMLLATPGMAQKRKLYESLELAVDTDARGNLVADVLIQLNGAQAPPAFSDWGVEIRTQVEDILVARAPLHVLALLAGDTGIRRVEMSRRRHALLDSSRVNIGVDQVHMGIDLPQAYKGAGVVVGVIDSGIDFNHPDFSNQDGSRILHLLEYTQGGGQNEWTKSELDNNPAGVSQKDGDGEGGHGSHVAGIAVGGGQVDAALTGVAPESDIIYVKGIREQDSFGGYVDTDVIAGTQYIFDRADEMGKPAVVNLSIGSHAGPHDGTSLYEQALSALVGPGKLIVAAAGNEGDDLVHAGGMATANVLNESLIIPYQSDQRAIASMWYEQGSVDAVALFAYDRDLNFIAQTSTVPVGFSIEPLAFVVDEDTLGFVTIDAITSEDPNNGDGNALFVIENNGHASVDISEVVWAIGSMGSADGRIDLWMVNGGYFYDEVVGFADETEMPGNNDYSVGVPATAEKVLSIGSYVTKTSWYDLAGDSLWLGSQPAWLDRWHTSSKGPTRDGRLSPDLSAPGAIVFSAFSSHLTADVGYQSVLVREGGSYIGKVGTSMAAPHVAGTIALMLQAKSDLTYEEAIQILSETARTNTFTGPVPNNEVGAGYLDAHAAVKRVAGLPTANESEANLPARMSLSQNYPNPFNPETHIEYGLASGAHARLVIYNAMGQQVRTLVDQAQHAGKHRVAWDGTNDYGIQLASGVYFLTLKAGEETMSRQMVLMR